MKDIGTKKLKIGILGGSFNPIHTDHIRIAKYIQNQLTLDKFIFIPNANPPHKNTCKIDYQSRVKMIELCTQENDDIEISCIEQDETVPHYSFDTITLLKQIYLNANLFFCMGMDSLLYLDKWKRGLELSSLCNLVVTGRYGYSLDNPPSIISDYLEKYGVFEDSINFRRSQLDASGHCFVLKRCFNDVSSSKIREEISNFYKNNPNLLSDLSNLNTDNLKYCKQYLSKEVLQYIIEHGLYKDL